MNVKLENRVFVNKPLDFSKIRAVGISVEHVLIQYTPEFYELAYNLIKQRLIKKNKFPEEINGLKYQHLMHAAAIAVDKQNGNALQIDEFGNIHKCYHGSQLIEGKELLRLYPSKSIKWNEQRYYLSQCALDQVQIQLYQQLVQFFEERYSGVVEPLIGTRTISDVDDVGITSVTQDYKQQKLLTEQDRTSSDSSLDFHAVAGETAHRESIQSEMLERLETTQDQQTLETQNQLFLQNALTKQGMDRSIIVQNAATLATIAELDGSKQRNYFGPSIGVHMQSYLDYFALFADVYSGFKTIMSFKAQLLESMQPDITRYAVITDGVKNLLKKWKRTKLVFVHTSQEPTYVLTLLKELLGADQWSDFIDFIIISETRRRFFLGDKPFRQYYPPQIQKDNEEFSIINSLKKNSSMSSATGKRNSTFNETEVKKMHPNIHKGTVGLGWIGSELKPGQVYINGNVGDFEKLTGVQPKHVLYCCEKFLREEQIYRSGLWHFCHILPQLAHELQVINNNVALFRRCSTLKVEQQHLLASNLSQQSAEDSKMISLRKAIKEVGDHVNEQFGPFGSCFMTTWGLTKIGDRLSQHCDLYTSSLENFANYAPFHMFSVVLQNRYVPHQYALIQSLLTSKQQSPSKNPPVVSEQMPPQGQGESQTPKYDM